jgi:hypothetical protein
VVGNRGSGGKGNDRQAYLQFRAVHTLIASGKSDRTSKP